METWAVAESGLNSCFSIMTKEVWPIRDVSPSHVVGVWLFVTFPIWDYQTFATARGKPHVSWRLML